METRANFILIGAFTLAGLLGTLGFFIWLARVEIDRQYDVYGILFDDVTGLDASGDVLFNGIPVGTVLGLRIHDPDPSKAFVTVEIDAATPVRENTVAQLQSQGVTGVAYISLTGGTPGAPPLTAPEDGGLPIIPSRRSTVQTLVEDAPDLLAETTRLLEQFQALTGPENQAYVASILRNLDASSQRLDQALSDFSEVSGTVRDATVQITRFTDRLDAIGADVGETLGTADAMLSSAREAFDAAETLLTSAGTTIGNADRAITSADAVLRDQLPGMLTQVSQTVESVGTAVADLQRRAGATLDGFAGTADLLNARLTELETTLAEANTAFDAVTEASDGFDALVDGEGAALVADARGLVDDAAAALGEIDTILREDVPIVVDDIRKAVSTASQTVEEVAGALTSATGRIDPLAAEASRTLSSAATLFENAQATLTEVSSALAVAETTLASAQGAFDSAQGAIDADLGPVLADIRTASDRIGTAVEDVTRDVPAIAEDLRALVARADGVVAEIGDAVEASAPGIAEFARTGLPELTRFGTEARNLVSALGALVRRIESDPAGFILDDRVPDYRR
jgi:phospholipid/cholesterol/gamma-HCH transport system substrate-binding protein